MKNLLGGVNLNLCKNYTLKKIDLKYIVFVSASRTPQMRLVSWKGCHGPRAQYRPCTVDPWTQPPESSPARAGNVSYALQSHQRLGIGNVLFVHYTPHGFCRFRDDTAANIASLRTNDKLGCLI